MKYLFYDLETTGVKHWRNGIHQIAGIIEIDGVEIESFDIKLQPHPKALIEDEALEIGGITRSILKTYKTMVSGHLELVRKLNEHIDRFNKQDKFHLVGFNNRAFDDRFLRALFELCEDMYFGSWFWSDSLDVSVLASMLFVEKRHLMNNFKLGTVARELGVDFNEDEAHNAFYDVRKTKECFEILTLV